MAKPLIFGHSAMCPVCQRQVIAGTSHLCIPTCPKCFSRNSVFVDFERRRFSCLMCVVCFGNNSSCEKESVVVNPAIGKTGSDPVQAEGYRQLREALSEARSMLGDRRSWEEKVKTHEAVMLGHSNSIHHHLVVAEKLLGKVTRDEVMKALQGFGWEGATDAEEMIGEVLQNSRTSFTETCEVGRSSSESEPKNMAEIPSSQNKTVKSSAKNYWTA